MRDKLVNLLDGADLFLRNRASAKHTPLNEYDIEAMLDIAEICDEAARILEKAIVPPCKVGDTLYMIVEKRARVTREYFRFIKTTKLSFYNMERVIRNFGKTVFLTKEEAKQAMEQRKEDEGK